MMLDLRARVALAAARDAADAPRLIARARRDAQSLRQESSECARALSDSLMAAVALSEGNRAAALGLLADAATALQGAVTGRAAGAIALTLDQNFEP